VLKHSRDYNLVRECVLSSGLSAETPGFDLQRACGTSLDTAIVIGMKIALGQIDSGIAAGVDTASDAPIGVSEGLRKILLRSSRGRSLGERLRPWLGFRPGYLKPSLPAVVEARTGLISCARGVAKSLGRRLPSCGADAFHRRLWREVPTDLERALRPLVIAVARLTRTIRRYDREVAKMCRTERDVAARLAQVYGVGELTALAFVLAVDDPKRFASSRLAGAYFGLVPRKDQSGGTDKQLRITKCGDGMVRRLLVQCAHVVLSEKGKDSALRRWGLAMTVRGGKNAKRRAVVAVARKLAVLLHALWISGEAYEPLRGCKSAA